MATSTDHGRTWKHGQQVGGDFGIKNAVFPTVVAGSDDRAAFAYLGTTEGGQLPGRRDVPQGRLAPLRHHDLRRRPHLGDQRRHPEDPVQRGSICTGGTTCGNDRNLLDFIDVTLDKHGRVLVGYADGCIGACVDDPSKNGHDAYATIARQSGGRTLFAKYDR